MSARILFVEDEMDLGNVVKQYLELKGFEVTWVRHGKQAVDLIAAKINYDLVILDIQLPDINGFEVAEQIKKLNRDLFFLFLTSRNEKKDRIYGLDMGAEDYIIKPFDIDELILRIKVILRRSGFFHDHDVQPSPTHTLFQTSDVTFDTSLMQLIVANEKPIVLTQREVDLLEYFFTHKNKVLKRDEILTAVWGENDYFMGRSLDVFISRLRKILNHSSTVKIENIYGVGFIFKLEE
ncbi:MULTISPECIES: response regulator transcription factor [Sphingobacterium]|uniref:Response regulator transcription factor n=1 Tax=Sphingobacterium thermophilum TaxID=768534 RepID=A0ABP8QW10_9SPHI|nr:response regulator transcription factor [Sphingobacterium sp. T2]